MAVAALGAPTSALAGTYTWNLASDFTHVAPGANPDHDPYGATPWDYDESPTGSTTPSTFTALPTFGVSGSLATWSDTATGTVVGENPTATPIVVGEDTIQPGIFVEPGSDGQAAAVGWSSPFTDTTMVSINGTVSSDATGGGVTPCAYTTTWTLEESDGTPLLSGSLGGMTGSSTADFSEPTVSIAAGTAIYIAVSSPPADAACDATGLSLQIQASGVAPAPTVTTPASGSSTTLTSPGFGGAAGADFGDGSQVTLRVYSGQSAAGSPVQSVTVPRSGAVWTASLSSPLPLGTYTAQAEQDDISSPADVGLSAPITFVVRLPSITLDSLGTKPLSTASPALTGTADTSLGSEPFAVVQIYSGTATSGQAVRTLTTALSPTGQFSASVTPALADGTYTAVAEQTDLSGTTGFSSPQTFSVDTQAPAVTLLTPGKGSRADNLKLLFTGAAGSEPFDSHTITVTLYKGHKALGKPYGTAQVNVAGSTWSVTWPKALPPAVYTAVASQTDAVGHVGTSVAHTFTVLPLPPVIGKRVTINGSAHVSVKITCNELSGDGCTGTVIVLTRGEFQPLAGGPVGHLTVMFAYVHIPGGQSSTVTRTTLVAVADVLRGHANVPVTVTATLHPARGQAIHAIAHDRLRHI
jgi:hypothetical protein